MTISQTTTIKNLALDHGEATIVGTRPGHSGDRLIVQFANGQERVVNPNGTWAGV